MRKFKPLDHIDLSQSIALLLENPQEGIRLAVEQLFNEAAIQEMNEMREKAQNLPPDERKKYNIKDTRSRSYRLSVGKIKLTYHRTKGGHKPVQTMKALEELEKIYQEEITNRYISGESDRDVVFDEECENRSISRETVSRIYWDYVIPKMEEFENKTFNHREFLAAQTDTMYNDLRDRNKTNASYVREGLVRVIALTMDTLIWTPLYLGIYPSESIQTYTIVFEDLINHDIGHIALMITDFHVSFETSIYTTLIGVEWQGCRFHLSKMLLDIEPGKRDYIRKLLHIIYDKTISQEEARKMAKRVTSAFNQTKPKVKEKFLKRIDDTLAYKDYPASLSRELDTTGQDERSNQESRRRLKSRYSSPNSQSMELLAYTRTMREAEKWKFHPEGSALTSKISRMIYHNLFNLVTSGVDIALNDPALDQYRNADLSQCDYEIITCNLVVLPIEIDFRIMSAGLLTVFGINRDGKQNLILMEQVKDTTCQEAKKAFKTLIERGLPRDSVKLAVFNRPFKFLEEGLNEVFPHTHSFLEPSLLLERLIYLAPEGFKTEIEDRFNEIYRAKSYEQAYEKTVLLKHFLIRNGLDLCTQLLSKYSVEGLISIYTLEESNLFKSFKIGDFKIPESLMKSHLALVHNPTSADKTIKALINALNEESTQ